MSEEISLKFYDYMANIGTLVFILSMWAILYQFLFIGLEYPASLVHQRNLMLWRGGLHFNWQKHFSVYGHPKNKFLRA